MTAELQAKLRNAASDAVAVQDACNLSGVVRSFHEILTNVLWPIAQADGKGTKWVNTHPISKAFGDKIVSLTGTQFDLDAACDAMRDCEALARPV